ncbi:MAG: CopD family protein [Gammaproteobacteria bacterium]|nr:CopD family protein [Gammaproteobacteria bacterium]
MFPAIAIAAHVIAAAVWTGGMFFAYVVLRPTLTAQPPEIRLPVWAGVFRRFFPWVWVIILTLLLSGYGLIFLVFGGFATTPAYIHLMQLLGLVMMVAFVYLYYVPYPLFRRAVDAGDWPAAGAALNRIRHIILVNLVLALLTVAIATAGRY